MRQYQLPGLWGLFHQQGKQHAHIGAYPAHLVKKIKTKTQVIKLVAVDTSTLPRNLVVSASRMHLVKI